MSTYLSEEKVNDLTSQVESLCDELDDVNEVIGSWWDAGGTLRGFVHSHPGGVDRLSTGDLNYIERLLRRCLTVLVRP